MTIELLRQVRVVDPVRETDRHADVLLQNGCITAIEETIGDMADEAIIHDCNGLVLGPGLVDLYSHSGEPGFESRETLASLADAAIAGGFTRLAILPDTQPAIDNPATLEFLQALVARLPQAPQFLFWGALTQTGGQQLSEMIELVQAGVVGLTDNRPVQNWNLLRRLLEYSKPIGKPIALWCCNQELAGNGVVRDGVDAIQLGLPGIPDYAETSALAALLECIAALKTPVHLMRISTARSVEMVREAKANGLPITASTLWMHLLLNVKAIECYDPSLHLDPPLGTPEDQAALIAGVRDGVIDAIAIEHTPFTYEEKKVAFSEAPPGAIGLEMALPLLWQHLVESGQLTAIKLWQCLSSQSARCLAQSAPSISIGASELVLFDPQQEWTVSSQTLKSQSSNTPWLGQQIKGKVAKVWLRGS